MAQDKNDVRTVITILICQYAVIDITYLTDDMSLEEDLGLDSLDTVEILMDLEDTFKIDITEDITSDITVGELIKIVSKYECNTDQGASR